MQHQDVILVGYINGSTSCCFSNSESDLSSIVDRVLAVREVEDLDADGNVQVKVASTQVEMNAPATAITLNAEIAADPVVPAVPTSLVAFSNSNRDFYGPANLFSFTDFVKVKLLHCMTNIYPSLYYCCISSQNSQHEEGILTLSVY
jgi:hypothetical protein